MIRVQIHGDPRGAPEAKDSKWVAERKALYDTKDKGIEEILLANKRGEIFEGSQTNFFIVYDGCVVTADTGILKGTVRISVLKACEELGIPVRFETPTKDKLRRAQGAFVTSTSRLVMPIHRVVEKDKETIELQVPTIVTAIAQRVQEDMLAESDRVFDEYSEN